MFLIIIFTQLCVASLQATPFELSNTSTWFNYPLETQEVKLAYDQWTWLESITVKTKKPVTLQKLTLQWRGKKIANLAAALYNKKELVEAAVIPIQKNVVAEGEWNSTRQELTFILNQKIAGRGSYHLLVSYPESCKRALKMGRFSIKKAQALQPKKCYLASKKQRCSNKNSRSKKLVS